MATLDDEAPVRQVRVGHIAGAAGLRGEVRFYHDSGDAEQLARIASGRIPVFIAPAEERGSAKALFFIESMRYSGRVPILKFSGVDDRNAAEALTGLEVRIPEDRLRPEEADTYLVSDLIGLQVFANDLMDAGKVVGRVAAVIDNPAHDILEIETPDGRRALLPMVDAYILDINLSARRLTVRIPEGLL